MHLLDDKRCIKCHGSNTVELPDDKILCLDCRKILPSAWLADYSKKQLEEIDIDLAPASTAAPLDPDWWTDMMWHCIPLLPAAIAFLFAVFALVYFKR